MKIRDYQFRKFRKNIFNCQFLQTLIVLIFLILPILTFAHCPLCTAGAGIGALIAKELGMKSSIIAIWIGAFAVALGLWLGNMVYSSVHSMRQLFSLRFGSKIRLQQSSEISLTEAADILQKRSSGNNQRFGKKLKINILKILLIILSFLSIVLPLKLYFYETSSFYLYLFGDYGSLFNRTYVYDKFLVGSILGGLILLISPLVSKKIVQLRQGKVFPYQGLIITFVLLAIVSIFFQFKM